MSFEINKVYEGITHIQDEMGVCMTLMEGDASAVLVDTGYGTKDVAAFVQTLTSKPVSVLLTHHHHDHVLGARWFEETLMFPEDMPDWSVFTCEQKRRTVLQQALAKGLMVTEEDFLDRDLPLPRPMNKGRFDLGGISVEVIPCPGHTPGSCVVYVPEHRLLLTGDDWNPCTWLFFDAALPVREYRRNIRRLQELAFTHVLCSHQLMLYPRAKFDDFIDHLTDAVLDAAAPVKVNGWEHVDTRQADVAPGQILVFDWNKYRKG